jgi:hypothetical protein
VAVATLPPALLRYLARFDHGEYWLAHEELEALWLADRRDVYKGLIHLAAASLHLERGNAAGALTKFTSAARCLASDAASLPALDAPALCATVEELRDRAQAGEGPPSSRLQLAQFFALAEPPAPEVAVELPYRVRRYEHGYRPGRSPQRRDDRSNNGDDDAGVD